MRTYFLTSLAVAGLALAHGGGARKSLGFGPVLPHAGLRTLDVRGFAADAAADPFAVADALVRELTRYEFVRRADSYTDAATGVTHVYFRQRVNGVEVADGDINVNIKDGLVLSYGNSFYKGPEPTGNEAPVDPRSEYCESLEQQLALKRASLLQQSGSQVRLGGASISEADLHPLPHLLASNCAPPAASLAAEHLSTDVDASMPQALLRFMLEAAPDAALADDIAANFARYRDALRPTPAAQILGTGASYYELVDVPGTVSPVKARLAYVQVPQGEETVLSLVWKFEVEMQDNWYEAAVGAAPPHNIISVVDWASDASVPAPQKSGDAVPTYNVFGWGVNDPSEGNRTMYKDTPDALASPAGWHAIPYDNDPSADASVRAAKKGTWRNTTTTFGNNVFAHENWEGRNSWLDNYRPDAGAGLKFDYAYKPKETNSADALDEAKKYVNATITQLFVTSNLVHDLYYRYGFTEAAGNFQQHNFGRGGREGDGVIANAQDGSGFNNANFMTPPDGQNGRCRMYLWNTANPYRDGDLEAGIVIHELSHGLSTRLTGGPADSGCLGWGESGGMGEGWGDFLATTIRATRNYSDYAMGEWAANRPGGIRNYVYSLNETVNPSTYQTLDRPGYWGVHAIGEVWAEMLWVVSQRLIAKHGYSDTLFPPAPLANGTVPAGDFYRAAATDAFGKPAPLVPKHGNTLAVQLVMNGMKLQPCRPSFFDARDAIIQADAVLTGGENTCELWRGFAARGLGPDATVVGKTPWGGGRRSNDQSVPTACKEEKVPEKGF